MVAPVFYRFKRYFSIGVLNTILHWCAFFVAYYLIELNQSYSNLTAFLIAVTFSFVMNARYTFQTRATSLRYLLFVIFMAILSFGTGHLADKVNLPPLFTLAIFSLVSLFVGFIYANYVVFRRDD